MVQHDHRYTLSLNGPTHVFVHETKKSGFLRNIIKMATKNRNKRQSNSDRTEEKKNPLKRQKLHKAYYSAANVLWQLNEKSGSLNSLMNRFTGDKVNVFFV